jgi:CTP:phosphocholine cytidylyltransferase-like protein
MNAIVLAAGTGSRLLPFTHSVPKPLTVVNEDTIIERQIACLQAVGIKDIHVVIGYRAEQFQYLKYKYNVNLIYNPDYLRYNNIYSMYLCREALEDTWILEGDVFICNNFLPASIRQSTYFSAFRPNIETEWVLEFSAIQQLERILTPEEFLPDPRYKNGAYIMSGISFWDQSATRKIKHYLNDRFHKDLAAKQYWDQIIKDHLNDFDIHVQKIDSNDCFEIDTVNDLTTLKALYEG